MNRLKQKIPILIMTTCVIMCVAIFSLTGCNVKTETTENGKLNVVATTTMVGDLTKIIGGDIVNVSGLMGPGIDPHLYQASAGDVIKMQEADVVVYNGFHLEGKMGDVFSSLNKQGRTVICIEDGIDESILLVDEMNMEERDPHIWFDINIWKKAAEHVAHKLSQKDVENSEYYTKNLDEYLLELDELEIYVKSRVNELPENQRVLITAHDAFKYFGNAYGFEVKGLQGISTSAETGTADVSNLADFIADNKIQAIFIESSVPAKNIEALKAAVSARDFEVNIGGELYSDSLGDSKSHHDNYIETFKANIDTIVDALK